DSYVDTMLQPGEKVYQLSPSGNSAFYFTADTLHHYGSSPGTLHNALQVPHNELYVPTIRQSYEVREVRRSIPAARGEVRSNPQHGDGGGEQIVVSPVDRSNLELIDIVKIGE